MRAPLPGRKRRFPPLLPLALLPVACATPPDAHEAAPGVTAEERGPTTSIDAGAVAETTPESPDRAVVRIVALSDFHGWLLPLEPPGFSRFYGGIANLAGMLRGREAFDGDRDLVLDNGDMWTGPTESTLLRGESVIDAYNALGVDAANIANHEFDFGQEILRARATQARFPFLGANIVRTGTDEHPDFLRPWILVERNGVKIGVIGLSYVDTPKTTLARHVASLEFKPYAETLARYVPAVRQAGAEVVVLLFHDEVGVVRSVLDASPDLGVHLVIAGQNHRKETSASARGVPIVNPGPFGRSYVRFDITLHRQTRELLSVKHEIVDVTGEVGAALHPPAPALVAVVESARQKAKALGDQVLGRLAKPLPLGTFEDSPLGHAVVDSWLKTFPGVDLAIMNHGALRQPLASGALTMGTLTGALPFENNLFIVDLTAAEVRSELAIDGPVVGGATWSYREKDGKREVVSVVDRMGKPLRDDKKYRVVILDFMYSGGDGFTFKDIDSTPEDTGVSWRQPIVRELRAAEATKRRLEPRTGSRARKVP